MNTQNDYRPSLVDGAQPRLFGWPDAIKRRELPLGQMPMLDHVLAAAYAYWHAKHQPPRLPARTDIDILEIPPLIKHLHIVDVSDRDPNEWRFRIVGAVVPKEFGWGFGRERVSGCPWPVYRQALLDDFGAVKETTRPLYQEVALRLDNRVFEYARVLMPLADDGYNTDTLMNCVVRRATPGLAV